MYLYAPAAEVTATGDRIFPAIVLGHLPPAIQVIFIVALISALFPSADGALTALTSSFCIDILGLRRRDGPGEAQVKRIRRRAFTWRSRSCSLALVLVFHWADNPSMIGVILQIAAYTYGPLLGLFAFGILTRRTVRDAFVPLIALSAPVLCYLLDAHQAQLFGATSWAWSCWW